ncbi:YqhA family protein [Insolitispirillum peregrinum]|uniref:UPF0114 protein SAMN05421779_102572 n=1 Tax=Insolitispirillum peregrinum TaxID=80876 RepID=A0A1N7K248_9PROT|nr:YqhA family protein [Insolitispirillum peregrinum]SIS55660.1 TIGR00645 family protein [Insolitispirillum peregrinum]
MSDHSPVSPRQPHAVEVTIEKAILLSRWVQLPLFLGLIPAMLVLDYVFFEELWHGMTDLHSVAGGAPMLILGLLDLVMVANLVVMVAISGYENFVSPIEAASRGGLPGWIGRTGAGTLKVKLSASVVGISLIKLLHTFLLMQPGEESKVWLMVVVHMVFVVSTLLIAVLDKYLMTHGHSGE